MKLRLLLAYLVVLPNFAAAELVRLEIAKREPYAGGKKIDGVRECERIRGTAFFALDPKLEANQAIVDLELCPRNEAGKVEFSADFEILAPIDRSKANGTLFYEVNNRGNRTAPGTFNGGGADDFLLRQGFVVVWSGWIAEVHAGSDRLTMKAPVPEINGARLTGIVRQEIVVDKPVDKESVVMRKGIGAYPPLASALTSATLTTRERQSDPRITVPRDQWRLIIQNVETEHLPFVELAVDGGLKPGVIYEVIYEAEGSLCQGAGLAGIRDLVSWLKNDASEQNPLRTVAGQPLALRAIGFGTSQSGRCLRQFLHDGFNADERGRRVFDGVMPHVAGGGLGSFNHRFAAPTRTNSEHKEHSFPVDRFPFAYGDDIDPYGDPNRPDGILNKARRAGVVPKVFHTQSSSEYWHRSGSLVHTDPLGNRDAVIPDEVRIYTFAGTQHGAGNGVPKGVPTSSNPADYRPLLRALIVAFDQWIRDGIEPPPSMYPKISDQTLVDWREPQCGWKSISGVRYPTVIHQPFAYDRGPSWPTEGRITREPPLSLGKYEVRVPGFRNDDNEIGCLDLPAITVPVATYASWALRAEKSGSSAALLDLQGSCFPFPKTAADAASAGDPRPSLIGKYGDFSNYQTQLLQAAKDLVAKRYLLAEDIPRIRTLGEKHRFFFE